MARADDLFLPPDPSSGAAAADPAAVAEAAGAAPAVELGGATLRRRLARIDGTLLERVRVAAVSGAAPAGLLDLNLFDDARFRVTDIETAPTSAGFSITGRLEGVPFGSFAIVVNGLEIAGSVRAPAGNYSIERGADGHVVIRHVDPSALPERAEPLEAPPGGDGPPGVAPPAVPPLGAGRSPAAAGAADPPFVPSAQTQTSTIDVLMVYTPAVRKGLGRDAIEARIDLWITEANLYFSQSGVNAQLRLAHAGEVDYEETPETFDLYPLVLPGDGLMDEVHAMRDAVGADVVHLVERYTGYYCGIAYRMSSISASFASRAFGATNLVCGSTTFAHEIGHNMGLNHDRFQANAEGLGGFVNTPHAGAYGYVNLRILEDAAPAPNVRWWTLMSYSTLCRHMGLTDGNGAVTCGEIGYFSNPNLQITATGHPVGVASTADSSLFTGPADAVATLNASAPVVAAFRAPPTSGPAVIGLERTAEDARSGVPTPGWTVADTLGWRIAFTKDVRNVSADDFALTVLAGSGFGSPTVVVTARTGSQRVYDIEAYGGGLASFTGEVRLDFAPAQNIEDLSGTALSSTWPAAAKRAYNVDNTGPAATMSPSTASSSPFLLTVRWNEAVNSAGWASPTVSGGSLQWFEWTTPEVWTGLVEVTDGALAQTIGIGFPPGATGDPVFNLSSAKDHSVSFDPGIATPSLSIGGLANDSVAENSAWTSAAPSVTGGPVGTVVWVLSARDPGFAIDSATGVVSLAPRDYEEPRDANADNVYEATVVAGDDNGNYAEAAVSVTVTDAAEARTLVITRFRSRKLPERTGLVLYPALEGDIITRNGVQLVDDGPSGDVTWSLTGADASRFTWSQGRLTLAPKDYENPESANGDNDYEVTLQGTDEDGNTKTESITVRIVDNVLRPLELRQPVSSTVNENASWIGGPVEFVGEPLGAATLTMSGADASRFRFDAFKTFLILSPQDFEAPRDANDDNVYEVTLRLEDEEGSFAEKAIAVTVTDVDETPTVTLSASPLQIREGASSSVTANLSSALNAAVTIPLTVGGTAQSSDYTLPSGITIPANSLTSSVSLVAAPDTDLAASETVTVSLDTANLPPEVKAGSPAAATVTIEDGTPVANLKISPNPVTEGSSATVTVELTKAWSSSLTFALATAPSGSSPAESTDYTPPGAVTVAAGLTSAAGSLATVDDSDLDDETLSVRLPATLPAGVAAGSASSVEVVIEDTTAKPADKPEVSLGVSPASVAEGGSATVTATLSKTLSSAVTIPVTVTRGTAEPEDFDAPSAIAIASGSLSGTTPLVTKGDADRDGETLTVSLGALPGEVRRGSPSSVGFTITDTTRAPSVRLGVAPNPVREGSFAVITATLSGSLAGPLRVPLVVTPGTAEPGDYVAPDAVTVSSGQTSASVALRALDDGDADDETVVVSLGTLPSDVTPGSPRRVTLTISDADGGGGGGGGGGGSGGGGGGGPPPGPPGPPPPPLPPPPPPPPSGPPRAAFTVDLDCPDDPCRVRTGEPVRFRDASTGSVRQRVWRFGDGRTSRGANPLHEWAAPGFFEVVLVVGDGSRESVASRTFLVESSEPLGYCESGSSTRCLRRSRFAVNVTYRTADDDGGAGAVVPAGTDDSGLFRFFDPSNWEVLVKVLDGCEVNGHFWVFAASTTDLGYEILVTDTATGAEKKFANEPGTPAPAVTDVKAFPSGCTP